MSKQLRQFYRALDAWLKAGQPPHEIFGQYGLCCSVWQWGRKRGLALEEEQAALFIEAGLDGDYPFNEDGDEGYCGDANQGYFNNPLRRAWVEEHAK